MAALKGTDRMPDVSRAARYLQGFKQSIGQARKAIISREN